MKVLRNIFLCLTVISAYAVSFIESVYLYQVISNDSTFSNAVFGPENNALLLVCSYLAIPLLTVLNGIFALVFYHRRKDTANSGFPMGQSIIVYKIILVPYFCIQAILIVVIAVSGYVSSFFMLFWPMPPLLLGASMAVFISMYLVLKLIICYQVIMTTSMYAVADISLAFKQSKLLRGAKAFTARHVVFIVLQFIPLASIISLPAITSYLNKNHRSSQYRQ